MRHLILPLVIGAIVVVMNVASYQFGRDIEALERDLAAIEQMLSDMESNLQKMQTSPKEP